VCTIKNVGISPVGNGGPGGSPTSFTISGTETGCRRIVVTSSCSAAPLDLNMSVTGTDVPFVGPLTNDHCACGAWMTVTIRCYEADAIGNPKSVECGSDVYQALVVCGQPSGGKYVVFACPKVKLKVVLGECGADGNRGRSSVFVEIDPPLPPNASYNLTVEAGDSGNPQAKAPLSGSVSAQTNTLPPVTFTFTEGLNVTPRVHGTITPAPNAPPCPINIAAPPTTVEPCVRPKPEIERPPTAKVKDDEPFPWWIVLLLVLGGVAACFLLGLC
jgi:hypothetical protein